MISTVSQMVPTATANSIVSARAFANASSMPATSALSPNKVSNEKHKEDKKCLYGYVEEANNDGFAFEDVIRIHPEVARFSFTNGESVLVPSLLKFALCILEIWRLLPTPLNYFWITAPR